MIKSSDTGKIMVRKCGCVGIVSTVEAGWAKFWNLFLCEEHGGPNQCFGEKTFACTVTHIDQKHQHADSVRKFTNHEVDALMHHLGRVQAAKESLDRLTDALKEALSE
jgi:hypothetical protein